MKKTDKRTYDSKKITDISEMRQGERGVIVGTRDLGRNIEGRLRDIGFLESEEIRCVNVSMLGDPIAYLVRGCVIALRRDDGRCVSVKLLPSESCDVVGESIPVKAVGDIGGVKSDAR